MIQKQKTSENFKYIPFTDRKYRIYRDGTIYSEYSQKIITGKCISKTNKRLLLDASIDSKRHSLLVNRLVYFVWTFNPLLKNKGTFQDFQKMPFLIHVDGNLQNNSIDNLEMKFSLSDVATWSNINFPQKFQKMLEVKRTTTILKEHQSSILGLIKKGVAYPTIGKQFNYSSMVIYRFAKINRLTNIRPNGKPKLSKQDVLDIRNSHLSGVELAKKYNISPTGICKIRKNKTYN